MTQPVILPSNLSDRELVAFIDHLYPNLQGPLRTMFERFEQHTHGQIHRSVQVDEPVKASDSDVMCAHCGSVVSVNPN